MKVSQHFGEGLENPFTKYFIKTENTIVVEKIQKDNNLTSTPDTSLPGSWKNLQVVEEDKEAGVFPGPMKILSPMRLEEALSEDSKLSIDDFEEHKIFLGKGTFSQGNFELIRKDK